MPRRVIIDFDANFASLNNQIDKIGDDFERFSQRTRKSSRLIKSGFASLGAGLSVGAFSKGLKSSLDFADSIGKLSTNTGIAVETIQELRFAGDQTGVSIDEVDKALLKFNKRLGLFKTQGGSAAAKAFEDLKINVDQVNEGVLDDVIDLLGQVSDESQRAGLATLFFGDNATKLSNTFAGGTSGIAAFAQEANDLGLILSEEVVRGSEAANDELSKIGQIIRAELTKEFIKFTPEIVKFSKELINAIPAMLEFIAGTAKLTSAIGTAVGEVSGFIGFLGENIRDVVVGEDLSGFDEFERAIDPLTDRVTATSLEIVKLKDNIKQLEAAKNDVSDPADLLSGINISSALEADKKRLAELEAQFERLNNRRIEISQQNLETRLEARGEIELTPVVGPLDPEGESAIEKLLEDNRKARQSQDAANEAERARKAALAAANRELAQTEREIQSVIEANRTPVETYIANVEKLEELRGKGLDENVFARAVQQEAEAFAEAQNEISGYTEAQQRAAQITEFHLTPLQRFKRELEELQELEGILDPEIFTAESVALAQDYADEVARIKEESEELTEVYTDLGDTIAGAFGQAITSGGSLKDTITSLGDSITDIIIQNSVVEPLGGAISGLLGNVAQGAFGGLLGGVTEGLLGAPLASTTAATPITSAVGGAVQSVTNNINVSTPTGTLPRQSLDQLQVKLSQANARVASRNL